MSKIAWKPGTMLAPVPPVMVTCGTMEKPNVLTVAWTGIINSEPPLTYISVRPSRFSHDIIKENGEFVINLSTLELAKACDYCGVKSGRNTDKIMDMNLSLEPCGHVKAPQLSQAPVSLECVVKSVTSFPTHDMFAAEIVAVNVDDRYLEEDGRLALEKAGLLAFVHGRYYTLGRDLGAFGFSVDKTKENKTKPRKSKFAELLRQEKEGAEPVISRERPAFKKKRPAAGGYRRRSDDEDKPVSRRSYDRPAGERNSRYTPRTDDRNGDSTSRRAERKFDGKSKFVKARNAENPRAANSRGTPQRKTFGKKTFKTTGRKNTEK